jgi:hypothetical protein
MRRKKNGPVFQLWATKQQLKAQATTAVTSFVSIKIDKLTGREGLD